MHILCGPGEIFFGKWEEAEPDDRAVSRTPISGVDLALLAAVLIN